MTITRATCLELDVNDGLAPLRDLFALEEVDAHGIVYLDGNSLGPLPRATASRVEQVMKAEWGRDLIRSWNSAGWITLSQRVGDKIARLVGAGPGELVVADSTSVNLYKVLSTAMAMVRTDAPLRRRILAERSDFPSDLYIADTLCREHGFELVLADSEEVLARLNDDVAVVLLTHVNYRSGRMYRMDDVTRAAHERGALMIWDLSHSAGSTPVSLRGQRPAG